MFIRLQLGTWYYNNSGAVQFLTERAFEESILSHASWKYYGLFAAVEQ